MMTKNENKAVTRAARKLAKLIAGEPMVRDTRIDDHGDRVPPKRRESRKTQRARVVLARREMAAERDQIDPVGILLAKEARERARNEEREQLIAICADIAEKARANPHRFGGANRDAKKRRGDGTITIEDATRKVA